MFFCHPTIINPRRLYHQLISQYRFEDAFDRYVHEITLTNDRHVTFEPAVTFPARKFDANIPLLISCYHQLSR